MTAFIVWMLDEMRDAVGVYEVEGVHGLDALVVAEDCADRDKLDYAWTTVEAATAADRTARCADITCDDCPLCRGYDRMYG